LIISGAGRAPSVCSSCDPVLGAVEAEAVVALGAVAGEGEAAGCVVTPGEDGCEDAVAALPNAPMSAIATHFIEVFMVGSPQQSAAFHLPDLAEH
jgi:hypothetical protein